jgi:hypothetical protein
MAIADPTKAQVLIPDAYLIAIGKVTVTWNVLELMLEMMIGKLAGMDIVEDSRAKIMVNHLTWPLKVDIFSALCNELVDGYPRLKEFNQVLALLKKAQEGRNRIVHGLWGCEGGKVTAARASSRGKLKIQQQEVTIEESEVIVENIHLAHAALYNLVIGS